MWLQLCNRVTDTGRLRHDSTRCRWLSGHSGLTLELRHAVLLESTSVCPSHLWPLFPVVLPLNLKSITAVVVTVTSTTPQYTARPTAQHSPHKYVEPCQCGPNPGSQPRSSTKPHLAGSGTANTLLIDLPHNVCHDSSLSHLVWYLSRPTFQRTHSQWATTFQESSTEGHIALSDMHTGDVNHLLSLRWWHYVQTAL